MAIRRQMLVLSARKPRSRTSAECSDVVERSQRRRRPGLPRCRAGRCRNATSRPASGRAPGRPSNSATGYPRARALTSTSAFSIAAIACWICCPGAWRVTAMQHRRDPLDRAGVDAHQQRLGELADDLGQAAAAVAFVVFGPAYHAIVGRDLEE